MRVSCHAARFRSAGRPGAQGTLNGHRSGASPDGLRRPLAQRLLVGKTRHEVQTRSCRWEDSNPRLSA
jgi:hypothetical protein